MAKLSDSRQLDWASALRAADRIVKLCRDSGCIAPEDLTRHREQIQAVCTQIDKITSALLITPPTPRDN